MSTRHNRTLSTAHLSRRIAVTHLPRCSVVTHLPGRSVAKSRDLAVISHMTPDQVRGSTVVSLFTGTPHGAGQ